MSRVRRSWWWIFAAASALALGGLGWVTRVALALETAEVCARADAGHQEALRLALWRMDSWLGPLLAAEASRPYFEYLPYYPQERAYTRILNAIEPGEVLSPSPLLTYRSDVFVLHFQLDPAGRWTSPQAPTGNLLDLAQETLVAAEEIAAKAQLLEQLPDRIGTTELEPALCEGERSLASLLDESGRNQLEFQGRARNMWKNQVVGEQLADNDRYALQSGVGEGVVHTGALVPLWLGDEESAPQLAYVRRVRVGREEFLQGVLVDWQRLERSLLAELGDLLEDARLVPRVDGVSSSLSLATLPAVLDAPTPPVPQVPSWTPARTTLLAGWISALLMLGAVGFTLHSSIVFGERRARFASAVTHELRTPLTTFRMYSEMLANGMVPEERRAEYLETLCRESDRLSGLVENVLAYARLEEGRSPGRRRTVRVDELIERALPELERRAEACGGQLTLDLDGAADLQLSTDPEAVGQILFNLVDNACKYGAPPFRISARSSKSKASNGAPGVELRVEDAGPGIPPERIAAVFRPFDRGGRDEADGTSGIGLGLALARGLARDLGGELELDLCDTGASFALRLPTVDPAT